MGDLNSDGHVDCYVGTPAGLANGLMFGDGTGNFTAVTTGPVASTKSVTVFAAVLADLTGDGALDIYAFHWAAQRDRLCAHRPSGPRKQTVSRYPAQPHKQACLSRLRLQANS